MLKVPSESYVVYGNFGELGLGQLTDGPADFDEAVDRVLDWNITHGEIVIRAFRMDMDVETNMPETCSDVTDEINAAVAEKLA